MKGNNIPNPEETKLLNLYRKLSDFEKYWIMICVTHLLAKYDVEKEKTK